MFLSIKKLLWQNQQLYITKYCWVGIKTNCFYAVRIVKLYN